jgi:GNAT superfamily N-acetyltransferase
MRSGVRASSPDVTLATLHRVQDVSADVGWREVLRIAPGWLVCRRFLGLVADLKGLALERPPWPEMRVTALEPADVPALRMVDPTMTCEEVARRLAEGQQCTLGWWGRELAHARWDSTVPVYLPYLGRVLRPRPGDQIVVGIYTAPTFRGRGIASAVMTDASRQARTDGVLRLAWLVAWWNKRSLGLARQFASRAEGTVGYWALGPWRRYFASGRMRFEADGSLCIGEAGPSEPRPGAAGSRSSAVKRQC